MIYPLKTERQTGLLFPEFGYGGRNGVDIGCRSSGPLRRPVNLTLTPRWLSKRGVKGDLEVEYVLGESVRRRGLRVVPPRREDRPGLPTTPFGHERWAAPGSRTSSSPTAGA